MIHIGIDTGTHTGFAVWDSEKRKLLEIETLTITQAMDRVLTYRNIGLTIGREIKLHIEDARLRKWYGNAGREKLQGVGSVKRDCAIWFDWCKENHIEYRKVAPQRQTDKNESRTIQPPDRLVQDHIGTRQGCRDDGVRIMKLKTYHNESRNQPNDQPGNGNPLQPSHR